MTNELTKTMLRALAPVPIIAAALFTASCSGAGADEPQVAQGTATPEQTQGGGKGDAFQQALAYSKCMRQHGVKSFPDPQRDNGGVSMKMDKKTAESPNFKTAQQACRHLQPGNSDNGGGTKVDTTKIGPWAQCIRDHGVPDFPDPKNKGNALEIDFTGTGIDPQSPAFKKAQQACRSKSPGGGLMIRNGGGGK